MPEPSEHVFELLPRRQWMTAAAETAGVRTLRQEVRYFQPSVGGRIAYSLIGQGPPLVVVPAWTSHLEELWKLEGQQVFCEVLSAERTVIHFDKWGTGLSERNRDDFSFDMDFAALEELVNHLGLRRFALMGRSNGAPLAITYAHRYPRRVSELVLYSPRIRPTENTPVWSALRQLMLADWTVATRAIAGVMLEGASAEQISTFAGLMESSATAYVTVSLEDTMSTVNVSGLLPELRTPTLVIARRGDTLFPPESAQRAAGLIPGAVLMLLEGRLHVELLGDTRRVAEGIASFLQGTGKASGGGPAPPLTAREQEVLSLIAAGLSNQEIATRLVLSVRTVERHAVNIYTKIRVSSRTEAVAFALRAGAATPSATT